jgi:hypothetical protein
VLDGLQEGSYSFHASPPNGGADAQKQVTLTGDTTVDLEVPQGHISGSVVEAGTRLPLADATLQIEESAGAGGGPRFGMKIATTDVSGRFALDGLEPRTQRLLARKAAYEAETRDVDAAAGEDIVIELKRGEGIGLQARDGIYGTPLRTLRVRVLDASGAAVFMGDVPLDADGRGEVPSLRPGTYELRIDAGGYAPRVLPGVTAPASGLALALTPGGTLDIQVGPETLARPNPSARLLNANGGPYLWSIFTSDGVLGLGQPVRRLSNVAPGSYSLVVDGGGTRRVDISEGGITSVTLP